MGTKGKALVPGQSSARVRSEVLLSWGCVGQADGGGCRHAAGGLPRRPNLGTMCCAAVEGLPGLQTPRLCFQCSRQAPGTSATMPLLPTGPHAPHLCFWRGRQLYARGGDGASSVAGDTAPLCPDDPAAWSLTLALHAEPLLSRTDFQRGTGSLAMMRNIRGAAAEGPPPRAPPAV